MGNPININTTSYDGASSVNTGASINSGKTGGTFSDLTAEERRQLQKLKQRDAEVKAHERAHKMAGGTLVTGAVNYDYEVGPDGRRYAVGGDVSIDTSKVEDDPEKTIEKAKRIKAAALAPAQPSMQDMKVAAEAARMEVEARMELQKQKAEEEKGYNSSGEQTTPPPDPVIDTFA